jgi:hypothetical protein
MLVWLVVLRVAACSSAVQWTTNSIRPGVAPDSLYEPRPRTRQRSSACLCDEAWAAGHDVRSAWSHTTHMAVGSSNGRSKNSDLMAVSLGIYGRADAPGALLGAWPWALGPLGSSLLAAEKRLDRQ